ncbi:MAG TPA: hypothetical protein VH643_23575 [Gemmataceae bacterium]|jgi:hypothetical protein
MAKTKATKPIGSSGHKAPAGNSQVQEKLTNKTEAVRRALAKLGHRAVPTEIQAFIKANFDVDMTTKVISVYKSKLVKESGKKGKPGQKPVVAEVVLVTVIHESISFKDLRTVKEIRNRLGPARMRELIELMGD